MHEEPDIAEVLRTIGDFLRDEVLPAAEPTLAYRTRVAANLVAILEREVRLGAGHAARERELLVGLLDADPSTGSLDSDVSALNALLRERLADPGVDGDFDRRAWAALSEIALDRLAVARPGYADDAGAGR